MLGLVKSSIGTKFTGQFGDLIAVSIFLPCGTSTIPSKLYIVHFGFVLSQTSFNLTKFAKKKK